MTRLSRKAGIRSFFTILSGQTVSMIGTELTGFAMAVWVYQTTGSVTKFSFIALATTLPGILVAPIAGTLVDRWDRRWTMILSDTGAALSTLGIAWLLYTDSLEIWKLAALFSFASICESFQSPAYSASVPLLVPKERLGQFNGLIQLGVALPRVVSPVLAGILVDAIHIWGVVMIDVATFLFALVTLLVVRIPKPERDTESETAEEGSLWKEATQGWKYLTAAPGLLAILIFFSAAYFTIGIVNVSGPALVLSFTSATSLGTALSCVGVGFVAGSILMSVWGGPKRLINGVLGFVVVFGLGVILVGLRPTMMLVVPGMLLIAFSAPMIFGCTATLWQKKVPTYLQGRVFALRDIMSRSAMPMAYLVAGPLADRVFEPMMAADGMLAGTVGRVLGTGTGRGVALMFVLFGALPIVAAAVAYLNPRVRLVEDELPDAIPDDDEEDDTAASLDEKAASPDEGAATPVEKEAEPAPVVGV